MGKIKKVERIDFPETNSSSSHSVVINRSKVEYVRDELEFDKDGYIVLESGRVFGCNVEALNSVRDKMLYVCAIYYFKYAREQGSYVSDFIEVHKKLVLLSRLVANFTGAKGVRYSWIDKDYDDEGYPEVDHNSSYIFDSIIESKESIKNFIFNRNSWLFTESDGGDIDSEMYNKAFDNSNDVTAEVTLDYGGGIGKVQFNVSNYPTDLDCIMYSEYSELNRSQCFIDIVSSIVFENSAARIVTNEDLDILFSDPTNDTLFFLLNIWDYNESALTRILKDVEDFPCVCYATRKFAEEFYTMFHDYQKENILIEEISDYLKDNYDKIIKVGLNINYNGI